MDENGQPYESLKDYYNMSLYEGIETTKIAGYDGYINILSDENDKYYSCNAGFLADDGVYDIYMSSNAYDDDGNVKEGVEELSEDDLTLFRNFVESIEKK